MLVTIARYRDITGDNESASGVIEDALVDAQALLEDELQRPLEMDTRTERCRIMPEARGAAVYPKVTPLTSVTTGGTIVGHAVVGGFPGGTFLTGPEEYASVTYVGGYDPEATDGPTLLPRTLERAIAWAAKALCVPDEFANVPAGATSVTVGDVSLTWGAGGSPAQGTVSFERRLVRRWKRRRDLVVA